MRLRALGLAHPAVESKTTETKQKQKQKTESVSQALDYVQHKTVLYDVIYNFKKSDGESFTRWPVTNDGCEGARGVKGF